MRYRVVVVAWILPDDFPIESYVDTTSTRNKSAWGENRMGWESGGENREVEWW